LGQSVILRLAFDIYSSCVQNLVTFASAVPAIWLRASK